MTGQQVYCISDGFCHKSHTPLQNNSNTTTTTTNNNNNHHHTSNNKKMPPRQLPFWTKVQKQMAGENLHIFRWTLSNEVKSWRPRSYAWAQRRFSGWTVDGPCGKGWNECEARSIFLVEEESMRKILIWKRSITWKEIKKKEKWFKDTDSFKRFHSMFPKKVWLLSKRPLTWRFQIDFFSIYSRKLCIINPSLTTGYGQPLRAFRQQAGFCTDGFHLELRCSFCKVLSLQEPWQ